MRIGIYFHGNPVPPWIMQSRPNGPEYREGTIIFTAWVVLAIKIRRGVYVYGWVAPDGAVMCIDDYWDADFSREDGSVLTVYALPEVKP